DFEGVILARFFRRHPELERIEAGTFTRPGLEGWAAATPDAMARHRVTGEVFVIEAKTDGRGDYQWGPTGSSEVPLGYYIQVQWQLHMTGVRRAYLVCLGPFYDETEHPIDYDRALAAATEKHCDEFYRMAQLGLPPEVDGHAETYNAIRRAHPDIDRGDHEDWPISDELAHEFEDAVHALDAAEEALNLARSKMLRTMGRARRAVIGHGKNLQVIATRQPTKKGASLYKFRKPIDWIAAALPPITK
ncbi:YqaJ viral recombinase family protein, partial [Nocardia salmonicida]